MKQFHDSIGGGVVDSPRLRELNEANNEGDSWVGAARLLWEERRLMARAIACGLIIFTLIAFLIPKQYKATAQLMPPDSQASGLAALASMAAVSPAMSGILGDLTGMKTTSATFIGILQSRTVADNIINEFDLRSVYHQKRYEDTRKTLAGRTDISDDRKSGIITITVADRDPNRARKIAESYVHQLDKLVATLTTSAARREREFLEQRLQVVNQQLQTSEVALSRFSSHNATLDVKEQGKAMIEAAATLEGQLIAAETELQGLRQIYSDNNVRVRTLQARIRELRNQMQRVGGTSPDSGSASELAPGDLYPSIRRLPQLGVQYADLYRTVKTSEIVFELLTRQYEIAKVNEAKEIPTVKVLDAPAVPERKSFPPRLIIILFGIIISAAAAATYVLARQSWSAVDPADPRKTLLKEILAVGRTKQLTWRAHFHPFRTRDEAGRTD